jgi:ABC-type uncharacterized transport system substrate-binding protein
VSPSCGTLSVLGIRLPSRLRRARRDRWWCSFTASRLQAAEELEGAFTAMTKARADAILVLSDPMTFFHRARIADLAAKRRLPTMHGVRGYVDAGGLISYWANQADLYRRGASYVDRILKGAKPGGLTHRAAERDSS